MLYPLSYEGLVLLTSLNTRSTCLRVIPRRPFATILQPLRARALRPSPIGRRPTIAVNDSSKFSGVAPSLSSRSTAPMTS